TVTYTFAAFGTNEARASARLIDVNCGHTRCGVIHDCTHAGLSVGEATALCAAGVSFFALFTLYCKHDFMVYKTTALISQCSFFCISFSFDFTNIFFHLRSTESL
ncbi:MAG: hypothetical protein V4467_04760, partial [Patescibacteria group bacterium]